MHTVQGVEQARRLAAGLRSLGLRPDVFLASEARHALQTAEILRDTLRPEGQYAIVAATALTPHTAETEFKWARMLEEAPAASACSGQGPSATSRGSAS